MYYLHPPQLCQKVVPKIIVSIVVGICQLYLDYVNCIWIVQLYLDCTIVLGLYNRGICITYTPPPLCQKVVPKIIVSIVVRICQLYLDYVNCIWIVSIVFGLCDFIWIVWLYLDCTIVFWLCQLYLDCTGFGKGGQDTQGFYKILNMPSPNLYQYTSHSTQL